MEKVAVPSGTTMSSLKYGTQVSVKPEVGGGSLSASMVNALAANEPAPDIDGAVDPEALRAHVKELLQELKNKHNTTHPSVLGGESVDAILKETEKYKKECS